MSLACPFQQSPHSPPSIASVLLTLLPGCAPASTPLFFPPSPRTLLQVFPRIRIRILPFLLSLSTSTLLVYVHTFPLHQMYRGLEHGPTPRLPAACDAYERGVSLGGMSKAYGLPGLRIGWLGSRSQPFMDRIAELKDYTSICPPAPYACSPPSLNLPAERSALAGVRCEVLAFIALRNKEALLARSRAIAARGLAACRSHVSSHPHALNWREPRGGTFSLVGLRFSEQSLRAGGSAHAYCEALRRHAAIRKPSNASQLSGPSAQAGKLDAHTLLSVW